MVVVWPLPSVTTAGWNVVASMGPAGALTADDVDGLLDKIETTIHSQPNRTRHAMNNVLIGIGSYVETLRPRALEVAKAIGIVAMTATIPTLSVRATIPHSSAESSPMRQRAPKPKLRNTALPSPEIRKRRKPSASRWVDAFNAATG